MRGRLDQDLDDFLANPPQPQRGFDVLAQGIRRSADSRFRSDRGQQTELEVEARAGQDLAVAELDRQAHEFRRYFGRAIEELVLSDTD